MPEATAQVACKARTSICRRACGLNSVITVLHIVQRNNLRKEAIMKSFIKQWLHSAALAAAAFTGQAQWYSLEEAKAAPARREPAKAREDQGFAPVLRAAD
ncbi:MAG: hypothetical protein C0454_04525 [Parvibaculum sp.]|nr:hypothetical protein [Parvibaculum sp.]